MSSVSVDNTGDVEYQGWLYKWTNYLKGYRRRWFVLKDGKLSYYRSQNPEQNVRDTINLVNSVIMLDEPLNIVISDHAKTTLHLRCRTEIERQKWLTTLELSKSRAIRKEELEEEKLHQTCLTPCSALLSAKVELQNVLQNVKTALEDVIENSENASRIAAKLPDDTDQITPHDSSAERKTLDAISQWLHYLQSSTVDMIISSTKCHDFPLTEHRCWKQMLMERERRESLLRSLENLARKHSHLQEAAEELIHLTTSYACHEKLPTLTEGNSEKAEYIIHNRNGSVSSLSIMSLSASKSTDTSSDEELVTERDAQPFARESQISITVVELDKDGEKLQEERKVSISTVQHGLISTQDLAPVHVKFSDQNLEFPMKRSRRTTIPERPMKNISVWSVLKHCIGKDLTKISMPIALCEPLSWLQRITEQYEYSELLDKAALCNDSCQQLVYISAYAVSAVCSRSIRTGKPFNPLLGETFECDRSEDFGWRSISEQVCHHPPVASQHCEGRGWKCWQKFALNVKFWGQYLTFTPLGIIHLEFISTGQHYTWKNVPTTVHNLIVGTLVVENRGDMTITNHTTGEKSSLKFYPHEHFSHGKPCRVSGAVLNKEGDVTWVLKGAWDSYIEGEKVMERRESRDGKPMLITSDAQIIWKRIQPEERKEMYHFSTFTCQLNEPEPGVAPTDSRNRPDIRCMEDGNFDAAAEFKNQLEDKQREGRRNLEKEAELAAAEGRPFPGCIPAWFKMQKDPITGEPVFIYGGEYWECKETQDWRKCPDIFL